ncbi:MAG: hypothetical protein Q8S73_00480 [Deltaproteobacteria bacterium]|nr:hypothetical protein [Myxococcales bacterium]MDP3212548.1 hypothetical protein [Deltaproteobacteria bacterium]
MTRTEPPPPDAVHRAIETYLGLAYPAGPPPRAASLADAVRLSPGGSLDDCTAFERDGDARFALRLGNQAYPHMKLVIERLPGRDAWFFRADTHDQHVTIDPSDPDHPAFQELMARNRALAAAIESAWELDGLDTFRAFLRRDLEARRT